MRCEYQKALVEATEKIRIGELRDAFGILLAGVGAEIAKTLPMYSDGLRLSPTARRVEIAASLKIFAQELEAVANQIFKETKR